MELLPRTFCSCFLMAQLSYLDRVAITAQNITWSIIISFLNFACEEYYYMSSVWTCSYPVGSLTLSPLTYQPLFRCTLSILVYFTRLYPVFLAVSSQPIWLVTHTSTMNRFMLTRLEFACFLLQRHVHVNSFFQANSRKSYRLSA